MTDAFDLLEAETKSKKYPSGDAFDQIAKEEKIPEEPWYVKLANLQNEENEFEKEIERSTAQGTSRILETVIGAPGDILSFAKSIFGLSPDTNLPTSKSLREFSEKSSLGYTKPQSEFEERGGEVLQDIASFMIPGSKQYSLMRNIGIPVLANLAKEGTERIGLGKVGNEVKLGTMVALDLMNLRNGGARAHSSKLFQASESAIPKGDSLTSSSFVNGIKSLYNSMLKGGSSPSKNASLKKLRELIKKSKNGSIPVEELTETRKSLNELLEEAKAFNITKPFKTKKRKIRNINRVKEKVIDALDEYGQINKEFGELNTAANESWAALESSEIISNFLQKKVGNVVKSKNLRSLLGISTAYGAHALGALGKATVIGAPAFAGYQAIKLLTRISKSPTLRRYYGNILKSAISGNVAQAIKNSKALDDSLEDEEE